MCRRRACSGPRRQYYRMRKYPATSLSDWLRAPRSTKCADLDAPFVDAVVADVADPYKPFRGAERQRAQQHAVDETEYRRARADAERHYRERERGEARVAPQRPEGVSKVAAQQDRTSRASADVVPAGRRMRAIGDVRRPLRRSGARLPRARPTATSLRRSTASCGARGGCGFLRRRPAACCGG